MNLKITALNTTHEKLGAKMVEFAGFKMPVSYTSINEEHLAVRNACGLFDVSHMGEFIIKGKEAENLMLSIASNDVSRLHIGEVQYSCLTNDTGGIIDDMLVYRLSEERCSQGEKAYMLVVNASNIEKDLNWIISKNAFDANIINISERTGLLALQGPNALQILARLCDPSVLDIDTFNFIKGPVAGLDNVLISNTGYTGSGGYELYIEQQNLVSLWEAIIEVGQDLGVKPAGLGARNTLRLEMGYCLYGNDIDDSTSPIEAGLSWITKLNRESSFPSKELFRQQKNEGVSKKMIGFEVLDGKRVPRHGYQILDTKGNIIGVVTSGTMSPSLSKPIGMGYIRSELSAVGNTINISLGKKTISARIVKLPFVQV